MAAIACYSYDFGDELDRWLMNLSTNKRQVCVPFPPTYSACNWAYDQYSYVNMCIFTVYECYNMISYDIDNMI